MLYPLLLFIIRVQWTGGLVEKEDILSSLYKVLLLLCVRFTHKRPMIDCLITSRD